MDFDVIIYVIIGIVWVIVSIIQANQKAKKKRAASNLASNKASLSQSKTVQNQDTSNTHRGQNQPQANEKIENWLAELMGVETQVPVNTEIQDNSNVVEESVEHIKEPANVTERIESAMATTLNETTVDSSNYVSQQYENDFLSDFDLRKAVIYSEILKRPYN